ncbi:uncharacterized protein B0H18DRAFT_622666 [Fomitopsis serialis]|uniref:uncharacterized protein n=1 Tax=Fomitopsis serialis TaxID=139415 RepID=UPI002008E43B|nr:uncharacterized protein B0H18DRAFT_622666 [Neoantrodia serialis]KAH9919837.1 hypothetical protein B0H18DRAFT_622666 [Neoantrodia serialis]
MNNRSIEDIAAQIIAGLRCKSPSDEHKGMIVQMLTEIRRLAGELPASAHALAVEMSRLANVSRIAFGPEEEEINEVTDVHEDDDEYNGGEYNSEDKHDEDNESFERRHRANMGSSRLSSERAQEVANHLQAIITNLKAALASCLYAPRDADDVLRMESILHVHMGLPLPLVWQILETAEYWVRSLGSCGDVIVWAHNEKVQEELCCTAKVPLNVKDYRPLRRIVFTIDSCDQGTYCACCLLG